MKGYDRADLLKAHGLLVRRVRRIGVFVALLFVFALNLWCERYDQLKRESAARELYLLSLPADSPLLKEAPPTGPFNSEDMPSLDGAIQNRVEKARARSSYSVFGLQLPPTTYVALLLFGSTAGLGVLWVTLRQLRTLYTALATEATDGSALQRTLNSLFFERVTFHYGQRWAGHVALGLFPIVVLAVATPFVMLIPRPRLDPTLYRQPNGGVSGLQKPGVIEEIIVSPEGGWLNFGGALMVVDIVLGLAVLASGATLTKRRGQQEYEQ